MPEFSESQRQDIASQAKVAREAAVEGVRQLAVLWEARLNLAMSTGDADAIRNVISEARMQSYMDNCDCGGGTTGSFYG